MKRLVVILSLVVALVSFTVLSAQAIPITGSIGFAGPYTTDTGSILATAHEIIVGLGAHTEGAATGSYAAIPNLTAASFPNPIIFDPITPNILPLWTLISGGITYTFNATSMVLDRHDASDITVEGFGTATITGPGTNFDPTPGFWVFTANAAGANLTFSESTTTVPEPATLLLLGCGLIGVAGFARRRFKKQ